LYLRSLPCGQAAFGGQSNGRYFVIFMAFVAFMMKTPFVSVSPFLL